MKRVFISVLLSLLIIVSSLFISGLRIPYLSECCFYLHIFPFLLATQENTGLAILFYYLILLALTAPIINNLMKRYNGQKA